ncbi:hypothetical protein [Massilia antarctica]|uniref:hypothetical protein n=1 Tax=Massilia antarctica TaxID=2765360 RepID=UPI0006BB9326|nr:hypothetical protein [Massilia sp. H27-R4]MCY0910196.1 hypothetical protein [Massilia sp. H27-R4]CUI02710.1 hypothetical protein BN2497_197 [Janthinobacterium sp. CG23_2]CUU26496.1 hypothetical protein BN3177_197 [Janthinobacterium sp. CG23_2]
MSSKKQSFVPYANEADVVSIGKLMIENRLDRITVSGDVDLTADEVGLAYARRLQEVLGEIVAKLEAMSLPAELPPAVVGEVDNPFN